MKRIILIILFCGIVASLLFIGLQTTVSKKQTIKEERLLIAQYGDHLKSNSKVKVESLTWNERANDSIRFILVHDNVEISDDRREMLRSYIDENKTVLFFSDDVNVMKTGEKLDSVVPIPVLHSDGAEFTFKVFGFGYSKVVEKKIPLFYQGNKTEEETEEDLTEDILNFLSEYKTKF